MRCRVREALTAAFPPATVTYHLSRNGQPTGTCTKEEAIARYARGEILPTDLVWCEGMTNWTAAAQVFGASTPPPPPSPVPSSHAAPAPVAPSFRPAPAGAKPANNLVWAILATLFCCLPAGVVAIVYAAQVDSKWNTGDTAGAMDAAKNAKTWCLVSAGVGLLVGVAYAAFMILAAASSAGAY